MKPIAICIAVFCCAFSTFKHRTLFVLGDSISLQYTPYLKKELGASVTIQQKGSQENALKNLDVPVDANGGDSRMVLAYLTTRIKDDAFKPDLLLLNCGLHDIKRNPATGVIAVDTAEYRSNLQTIVALLRNRNTPLVWVRTTEVIDSVHAAKSKAFNRYAKDVEQYNTIADAVCQQNNIRAIDLYTFTRTQGDDRFADHVHYIPRVMQSQAQYIAGALLQLFKDQKHGR